MSSTRNNKRKRAGSKAGVNSTSSNQRAVAPESAQDDTTIAPAPAHTAENDVQKSTTTTSTAGMGNKTNKTIPVYPSTTISEAATSSCQVSRKSREKGGTKNTNEKLGGRKRPEPNNNNNNDDEKVKRSSSSSNEIMTDKKSTTTSNSINASSSCSSSQDGPTSTTRKQALHIMNDDDDQNHDREKRIQNLILHRSMLLERVGACRLSAEKRIGELSSKRKGNNEPTDNEEIAAFRNMTKQANQAARKSRGDGDGIGGTTEKRSSLSLRRGSTVGKRMNVAISSLVPGLNVTNTTASVDGNNNNTVAAQSFIHASDTENTKSSIKFPSTSTPNNIASKPTRLPINPAGSTTITTTTKKLSSTIKTIQPNNGNPKLNKNSSHPMQSTKQQYTKQQLGIPQPRGRPPNNKNNKLSNKSSAQQHAPASKSDQNPKKSALPVTVGSSMMTKNNLNHLNSSLAQSVVTTKVNFPEAILLREKRDQIQLKLKNLLERQHSTDQSITMTMSGTVMKSSFDDEIRRGVTSPGGVISNKPLPKKKINFVNELEIPSPAALPQRRKTHWDTVLQEMSWLASDFIEERKWKLSAARLLSSNIPVQGLSDRRKRSVEVISHDARELLLVDGSTLASDILENSNSIETKNLNFIKDTCRRRYTPLATEDEDIARSNSQLLSCMISELDDAIQKGGSFEATDRYHQAALKQFVSTRSDILERMSTTTTSKYSTTPEHPKTESSSIKDDKKDTEISVKILDVDNKNDSTSQKNSNFDSIDNSVNQIYNVCKSKCKSSTKEMANSLRVGKVVLHPKQTELIDFVDKLWSGKPSCSGAMIVGPTISGKTFATASIIWKQRTKGPQLLICPSRSMIRWKHELNLFSDIRVLTFGLTGGISSPNGNNDVGEVKSTDVIVCEYSTVNRIKIALNKMRISLFSVTTDLRHFLGLRVSLGISSSVLGVDPEFPSELMSNSWWGDLIAVSKNRDTRCLFVDYCGSDPLFLSKSGLGQKEQISIIAKRAACVIGPEIFETESHSIQQQVISWARKKGKTNITNKVIRVRKVLSDAIDPMCFRVENPIVSSLDFKWDLRSCSMTSTQREEYEKCCYSVRGALSLTLLDNPESSNSSNIHSFSGASNALFRLRQLCFYAKGRDVHSTSVLHNGPLSGLNKRCRNLGNNPSQPDFDNVDSILNSSSKLKALVIILIEECGYNINCEGSTRKILGLSEGVKTKHNKNHPVKKVVIFAALPDIQCVVSALLNSLGIQNELLCRDSYMIDGKHVRLDNSSCPSLDHHLKHHEAVAWAKSQSALSRFCDENHSRRTNIIVAAPGVFSGLNYGLGVEGADMIISLDSDWSGRDGFIVNSLVRRWRAKNELIGKDDKLIRLICADSVEAKFFSNCHSDKGTMAWPLDSDGFLTIPSSQDEALKLHSLSIKKDAPSSCSFPALCVLQKRGDLLSDVLVSSRHLPSFFEHGEAAKFLPRCNIGTNKTPIEEEITKELQFLRYFLQKERISSVVSIRSCASVIPLITPTLLSYKKILPIGSMSRQDLPVMASRLFLEKLVESHSLLYSFEDNFSNQLLQPIKSFANDPDAEEESLSPTIDHNPSSLLFYKPCQELVQNNNKRRYNVYAKLFSSSWDGISVKDGNQGCEPLVYFPPLFPLLEECSKRARIGRQGTLSAIVTSNSQEASKAIEKVETNPLSKRKDRGLANIHDDKSDIKRLKIQSSTPVEMNGHVDVLSAVGLDALEESLIQPNGSSLAISDKLVLGGFHNEDYLLPKNIGQDLRDRTEIVTTKIVVPNSEIVNKTIKIESNGFIMTEEDFGLVGAGAIPKPDDAISFSAQDVKANSSSVRLCNNRFDFTSYDIPCDAEETGISSLKNMDEGMQSVLLFVKNRPMSYLESQASFRHAHGVSGIVNKFSKDQTADESVKKTRKRGSQMSLQMPPTAITRLPGSACAPHSQILPRVTVANSRQTKGDHRHKLLASFQARQRVTGLTLFDSIPYRVAAMRVERRVTERVERLMWECILTHDAGPGLPIQLVEKSYPIERSHNGPCQGWDSIIQELKDGSSSGDAAVSQSIIQRQELRSSLVSPRCVDFGTFEAGYLASPSGMTVISTPRSRIGVSLPMGVKVMQPTKEQKQLSSWNARDDKILEDAAKKFGMNWLLVASAMSGFEQVFINENIPGIERIVPSIPKSARQCRDRWQALAQTQPALANEVRKSERLFRENASLRCDEIENNTALNKEGKAEVYSAGKVFILSKSTNFLKSTQTKEISVNSQNEEDGTINMDIVNDIPNGITSSRNSSCDKKQDDAIDDRESSDIVCDGRSESEGVSNDVDMRGSFPLNDDRPKLKRRSFSAISIARSKRQIIPMSIPGVVPGSNQAGHPAPSHPSHMQSVQSSVAALWASGRTEMWPLQILDLADKQKSGTTKVDSLQRGGDISTTSSSNSSRRHGTDATAYQHPYPPTSQPTSTVRAPVAFSPVPPPNAGRPPVVVPRPVNTSISPHHQHRNPPVAPATAQAYIPPPPSSGTSTKPKNNEI